MSGRVEVLRSWQIGELMLTEQYELQDESIGDFYAVYLEAFGPLAIRAAARHVLDPDEFAEEMRDPRIWKYVAWDQSGEAVGMATLTNDTDAVAWISPEFYAARYPEHASRNAIYYQGYSLVRPGRDNRRVYHRLAEVCAYRPRDDRAVVGYDLCEYNIEQFRLDERIERISLRQGASVIEQVDRQSYYTLRFD